MRHRVVLLVLLFCPLSTGCAGLFPIGARNLLYEARLVKDSRMENFCDTHLAQQASAQVRRSCPQQKYSADYSHGFKSGFVDYLYAGGNGEPPAFVPKRYLTFHEQKTNGSQGLIDWYAGFRHGAAVAHASGVRQARLVALPPPPGPPPPPFLAAGPLLDVNNTVEKTPILPMPRNQTTVAPMSSKPAGKTGSVQLETHGPEMQPVEEEEDKAGLPRKEEPDPEEQP